MLNMLQKGAYQSWKFLQKQTPRTSKRSLLQLKSKSPAQFYSSSTKILKPKRTVEFKKNTNLHNQKRWKRITISTSKTKTFPRVERERETLPNAINDEDILALVVNNSLPCNCLDCHDVSEDRNNFEPMVFTHSTPMKMNETSAQVDNIPDGAQDSSDNLEGEGNSTSTSSSSDEFILHGPAKTFFPTIPGDGCCVFGDCEASPILDKKVIQPDSNFISSLQSLYEEEGSRDSNEKQDDDIGNSSSIQNEEKTFSNLSVGDDDAKNAEDDEVEETHDLERSSRSTSSPSFIYRRDKTLSSDEEDNEDDNSIYGSQEGDEIPVNSQFTEFVLRRHKSSVKKESYNDH